MKPPIYKISIIEMRVFCTKAKYLKSAARLLYRDYVNRVGLDTSKEVQWVSVAQRTAELPFIKVGCIGSLYRSKGCKVTS